MRRFSTARSGRGALIFTGSVAGSQPLPLHAVYSATKVFDNFLGEALWGELQGTGIDSLSLLPGSTETEFQHTKWCRWPCAHLVTSPP